MSPQGYIRLFCLFGKEFCANSTFRMIGTLFSMATLMILSAMIPIPIVMILGAGSSSALYSMATAICVGLVITALARLTAARAFLVGDFLRCLPAFAFNERIAFRIFVFLFYLEFFHLHFFGEILF